jgi:hypothetical protein
MHSGGWRGHAAGQPRTVSSDSCAGAAVGLQVCVKDTNECTVSAPA